VVKTENGPRYHSSTGVIDQRIIGYFIVTNRPQMSLQVFPDLGVFLKTLNYKLL
jgi:hypothetical protein